MYSKIGKHDFFPSCNSSHGVQNLCKYVFKGTVNVISSDPSIYLFTFIWQQWGINTNNNYKCIGKKNKNKRLFIKIFCLVLQLIHSKASELCFIFMRPFPWSTTSTKNSSTKKTLVCLRGMFHASCNYVFILIFTLVVSSDRGRRKGKDDIARFYIFK